MVMIGIDPHKGSHTAVAVGSDESVLCETRVRACSTQLQRLSEWASQFDERVWAVESAGGLGYLLSQQLVSAGEVVFDVPPVLSARVRLLGSGRSQKNDPNDARSVAIAALRSDRLNRVVASDHSTVLAMLAKRHRDLAQFRAKSANRLHALLVELEPGGIGSRITTNKAIAVLDRVEVTNAVVAQRCEIAYEIVADIVDLDDRLKASRKRVETAVAASGTCLCDIVGVGPIGAAMIIGAVGDIDRFKTKAQFASFNATAPVEASSGERARHRVNLRGNRRVNSVIYRAAITQIGRDTPGRAYYDRKRTEGKNHKEALRCLMRQISNNVYRHLVADQHNTQ